MLHVSLMRDGPRTSSFAVRAAAKLVLSCMAMAGCAPELTEPADFAISGAWFADGPAAGLTDVRIQISQTPDGVITGTYTAIGTEGLQFCPPAPPCSIAGTIAGSNTVLQVFFEMEHAGRFTGQLLDSSVLRGALERGNRLDPVEFLPILTVGS